MSSPWTTRLPPSSRPEPGYHLNDKDCYRLASLAMNTARDLVAVHWRHRVEDHPLIGDQVDPVIQQAPTNHGPERICSHIEADFRLAVRSRDQPSVASRSGLIPS